MSNTTKKFIDPAKFTEKDFPIFILCNSLKDPFAATIKMHTVGNYSHAVVMITSGKVVSQDYILREKLLDAYGSSNYILKFIKIVKLSKKIKEKILESIKEDLKKPWYRRLYDILGFIGQAIKIPKLNTPWLYYCSENVAKYMRIDPRINKILKKQVSPSDINRIVDENPDLFKCLGYWIED